MSPRRRITEEVTEQLTELIGRTATAASLPERRVAGHLRTGNIEKLQADREYSDVIRRSTPSAAAPGASNAGSDSSGSGTNTPRGPRPDTGLGPEVDELVAASPSILVPKLDDIQRKGWQIRHGPPGEKGSYTDRTNRVITINHHYKGKAETTTATLAHELGHAHGPRPQTVPYDDQTSPLRWIDDNKHLRLRDEGRAQFTAVGGLREISQNHPDHPRIAVPGRQGGLYEYMYDMHLNGVSEDETIDLMALGFEREIMSTTREEYGTFWRRYFEDEFVGQYLHSRFRMMLDHGFMSPRQALAEQEALWHATRRS